MKQPGNLQLEAMRLYRALMHQRTDWGGRLVLLCGPGRAQTGAPAAVSIADGATLALDSNAAAMKAALRAGYLDFVVNSLDEALRALKNQVRQKRGLSVGLIANVDATLAEMAERGVQPDLQLDPAMPAPHAEVDERFFPADDAEALRKIDAALFTLIPVDDILRRRWIERSPRFLREARSRGRWIWLSEAELATLAESGIAPVEHA
jgi:urocanate hydratase